MKVSEFWRAMDYEFGPALSQHLAKDLVLSELGQRTAQEALEAGLEVQSIWRAVCSSQDLSEDSWFGPDLGEPR